MFRHHRRLPNERLENGHSFAATKSPRVFTKDQPILFSRDEAGDLLGQAAVVLEESHSAPVRDRAIVRERSTALIDSIPGANDRVVRPTPYGTVTASVGGVVVLEAGI